MHLKRKAREIQDNVGTLTKEEGEDCLDELTRDIAYVKKQVMDADREFGHFKKEQTFGF